MEQILDQEKSQAQARYAGFWIRFVGYLIDSIILFIVGMIEFLIIGAILNPELSGPSYENPTTMILYYAFSILTQWLYFGLLESSEKQATLGKMVVGVRVVDQNMDRISFGRATGRYFGKLLSALILLIGFIMAGFDSRKQALHDKLADTFVVYGRA